MKRTTLALISAVILTGVLAMAQAKPADLAYNNGYQAGYKLGSADKKTGERQDYNQASAFRRATDGWKEGIGGDLEAYRTSYRNGFADGYRDGVGDEAMAKPVRQSQPAPIAPPPMERDMPREREPEVVVAPPPPPPPPPPAPEPMREMHEPRHEHTPPVPMPAPMSSGITVADGTMIRVRLNSTITTRTNRQGDTFTATVTEPVYLPDTSTVAIPAGAVIAATITQVHRPGRVKGTGEMHMRYERLTMPGGGDYAMSAVTASLGDERTGHVNEAEGTVKGKTSHGRDGATVGGAAAGGAIIGGVAGGPAGAGVGALIGAGVGLGGVLVTRGKDIDLPKDTPMQIKLQSAMTVTNPVR